MTYTQDDYAILSLMVRLPRQQNTDHSPLDLREYNQLVKVLLDPLQSTPAELYNEEIRHAVEEHLPAITAHRTHALLEEKRHAIALLLEQVESMGITVVTRRMDTYPQYLKEKLGAAAPPCLYMCGAGEIANAGGIGIVGSRLRRGWGPVFVRTPVTADDAPGNAGLVQKGAIPATDPDEPFWQNTQQPPSGYQDSYVQQDMFMDSASEDGPPYCTGG